MGAGLKYKEMLRMLRSRLEEIGEPRQGRNKQYELGDVGMSAFSVFYMQSPSFLSWQQDMEKRQGRNNAHSLFGIEEIPCVEQIKNILDRVDEKELEEVYWQVYEAMERRGQLQNFGTVRGTRLISLDGTQHHSSQKIHCQNCRVTVQQERAYYSHQVLLAVVNAPGQEHVICLAPEFIRPQDGKSKQDCEQAAIKRWLSKHSQRFAPWSVTLVADDLHSHQPTCELVIAHQQYFIFTCKRESHSTLYEELDLLSRVEGAIGTLSVRQWVNGHYERWVYRWAEDLPLRRGEDALRVNWCEWSVYDESTGEQIYYNAWITNHEVNEETVMEVTAGGRSRWKVENEGINVLKNQGYHFEHNYGHGKEHLANVLLSLLLLAFLVHTVLHVCSEIYQAIRQALGARRKFFNDIQALTRYFYFGSWEQLMTFMFQGLELDTG